MARITYVKAAQQRYATVPVLDENGNQKTTPVMRKSGAQKTTKRGREVVRRVTVVDKSQPLPNRKCGKCGKEIEVGQPYKWIAPKSGPYGGRKLYRCGTCPNWRVWEYSSSLSARLAEIAYNFSEALASVESEDDVTSALSEAAEAIREIAQEKEDGADNIESGFGHETSMSEELRETAQSLNDWADEIEQCDIPDFPEPEEDQCDNCGGTGQVDNPEYDEEDEDSEQEIECDECDGTGVVTPDEPTQEQIDEWRSEVESACSIVDESPV